VALAVDVLGPVRVRLGGSTVEIAARKPRAVIAMLAMHAGQVVSTDALIDGLWGDEPPDSAENALQVYVAGLRKSLGSGRELLRTRPPGYVLEIDREAVDALRFEDAVARSGSADEASMLAGAFDLWRGTPFEDLGEVPFAQPHITRLMETRLLALEQRIEADLSAGRHVEVIAELETLVVTEPYRERLWRQLGMALYRAGRQADALAAIRRVRAILRDDLGLDPGPPLLALEQAILQHDPALTLAVPDAVGIRVPAPTSGLIGRDADRHALVDLVLRHRLVTITGLGGVGKTRLATDVALDAAVRDRFARGVVFVDLSGTTDAAVIVAEATRVAGGAGQGEPMRALAARLGDRPSLLILDNLEQIEDAGNAVVDLLRVIPVVHVLATSRTPLRVASEHVVHLEPLDVEAAIDLFSERASSGVDRDSSPIRAIAERLDGLPLAIELAAAASRALSPADLLDRLAERLPLPQGPRDLPARQRTLEATLDWSLGLLDPRSRELVDVLTVFESPFGLDAIESVGDDVEGLIDSVAALVESGLLSVKVDRYRMLPSIRDVIRARIDVDRAANLANRHATWIASTSRRAYQDMHGAGEEVPTRRRIAAILPDVRAAIGHLLRVDRHEEAARILLWTTLVWFHEGIFGEFQERLADATNGSLTDSTRAEVDVMRGIIGWMSGEAVSSLGFIRDGVAVLRSHAPTSVVLVNGLCHLASAAAEQGRGEEALLLADEAVEVARHVDDPGSLPLAWEFAGYVAHLVGDGERAVVASQAAVDVTRRLDSPQLATSLAALAAALADVGRQAEAIQAGWEAIEVADRHGSAQQIAETVVTVAPVVGADDPSVIAGRVAEAVASYVAFGALASGIDACLNLARLAAESHPEEAARLVGAMDARGRDRVPEGARRLGDELRERLGPQAYAHEHALGTGLSDDDLARLARALAAELRAAPVG
jgi:DNA-binding SARP family transcriptional activator/predicted ATPase